MGSKNFIAQFEEHIVKNKLFRKEQNVLLAVSGGMDSVVMTSLFKQAGFTFGIAHCNFQLREAESNTDEQFVKTLAEQCDVPFYVKRFDTMAFKQTNKMSLEEAARHLRYEWFEEIQSAFAYSCIATAHHINDSLETAILHFIKGTGVKGMQGIPVQNNHVIRPLLFASKEEIESFAKENDLQYRTDASNSDTKFQRNKIRHAIIPLLKEINPSLENTFAKNVQHFTDAEILMRITMDKTIKKLLQYRKDAIYIPLNALKNLPAKLTFLHEILQRFRFNEEQAIQISNNLSGSGKQFLSLSHRVIVDRNFLIITGLRAEESKYILIEKETNHIHTAYFSLHFDYSDISSQLKINQKQTVAFIDADTITFPLTLRVWKKGDYFYPLGMYKNPKKNIGINDNTPQKPAKKKISDILTDLKTDLYIKENTYVLLSGEKIIWVAGIRQDERFKMRAATKKLLKITMTPEKGIKG